MHAGLVSITFRQLTPDSIVDLARKGGILGIEWGGDIHVPHGDLVAAEHVGRTTRAAGLTTPTYGSYYKVGCSEHEGLGFTAVLDTALALGAPAIRVWAGNKGSADAEEHHWDHLIKDLQRICGLAHSQGIQIFLEYHAHTLNDTPESSLKLLANAPRDQLYTLWQPANGRDTAHCLGTLQSLLDRVRHVHAFNWHSGPQDQTPLREGADRWNSILALLGEQDHTRYVLLEFVKNGSPDQFLQDAFTLHNWLRKTTSP